MYFIINFVVIIITLTFSYFSPAGS